MNAQPDKIAPTLTPHIDEEDWLERKDVAKLLNVGIQQVYVICRNDSTFPRPLKFGRCNQWRRGDVVAWKKARFGSLREENAARLAELNGSRRKARK